MSETVNPHEVAEHRPHGRDWVLDQVHRLTRDEQAQGQLLALIAAGAA
jgi:hypothetical protein